jgi:DNA polymerase-1
MNLEVPVVFHNAKFDIHVLRRVGIQIPEAFNFYDTMLMCHLINEEEFNFSLQAMAGKYLGASKEVELARAMKKDMKWEETPAWAMARYAERDAKATYDLYLALKPRFEEFENYWEREREFLLLLQGMETRGVQVDLEMAHKLKDMCEDRLLKIQAELGFNPNKRKELHGKLFDPPPMGIGLKVKNRTPGGQPKVDTKFLETTNHPVAGLLLEHSETKKQLTSYYNSYIRLCEGYGRIHPSFKQHGTRTGRLSCADPNMQQIPRESPIKKLFLTEPGKQLWEIDFRNIEMRLAAVYSGEPSLLNTFANEGDVHQLTADLLGISRQHAKTVNFLIIYGGGARALSAQIRESESKCKDILDDYRKAYPNLFARMRQCTQAAENNDGVVRLWSGRKRHFRTSFDYHKAFNSIIQGGAFEIVKESMLRLQAVGFDIRNQVHDSVWLMVDNEDQVIEAERVMTDWTEPAFKLRFSTDRKRLA